MSIIVLAVAIISASPTTMTQSTSWVKTMMHLSFIDIGKNEIMDYKTALEVANILYRIESLDDLNDRLKQIHLNLEDSDEENIILETIEKINAKQDELRKKIDEL